MVNKKTTDEVLFEIWNKLKQCSYHATKLFYTEIGEKFQENPRPSIDYLRVDIYQKISKYQDIEKNKVLDKIILIQEYDCKKSLMGKEPNGIDMEIVELTSFENKKKYNDLFDQNPLVLRDFVLSLLNPLQDLPEGDIKKIALRILKKKKINLNEASRCMRKSLGRYYRKCFYMIEKENCNNCYNFICQNSVYPDFSFDVKNYYHCSACNHEFGSPEKIIENKEYVDNTDDSSMFFEPQFQISTDVLEIDEQLHDPNIHYKFQGIGNFDIVSQNFDMVTNVDTKGTTKASNENQKQLEKEIIDLGGKLKDSDKSKAKLMMVYDDRINVLNAKIKKCEEANREISKALEEGEKDRQANALEYETLNTKFCEERKEKEDAQRINSELYDKVNDLKEQLKKANDKFNSVLQKASVNDLENQSKIDLSEGMNNRMDCSSNKEMNTDVRHSKKEENTANLEKFKCTECDSQLKSKIALTQHYKIHNKTYQCPECEKVFARNNQMHNHLKSHLKKRERNSNVKPTKKQSKSPVSCSICDQVFSHTQNMKAHYRREHEGLTFSCEQCDKKYTSAYARRNHVRAFHDKKRPFKCKICNKTFPFEQGLSNHTKSKSHQRMAAKQK